MLSPDFLKADVFNNLLGQVLGEASCEPSDCYKNCRKDVLGGDTKSRR